MLKLRCDMVAHIFFKSQKHFSNQDFMPFFNFLIILKSSEYKK